MCDVAFYPIGEEEPVNQQAIVDVEDEQEGDRCADVLPPVEDPLGVVASAEKEDRDDEDQ